MKIWLNGAFVSADEARIDPFDRGFLLGDGLFETIRVSGGSAAWLSRHMDRLSRNAGEIGLDQNLLPSPGQVTDAIAVLGRECGAGNAVARLTVSRGVGPRGLLAPDHVHPTIMLSVAPFSPPDMTDTVRLATAKRIRRNPWSIAGRIKSVNYLDNIAARSEAATANADDALILSIDGAVAETTIANICVLRDGQLFAPGSETGALDGLGRDFMLSLAEQENLTIGSVALLPEMMMTADVVFVVNALQGPRSVFSLDGKAITLTRTGQKFFEKAFNAFAAVHA
jgi:branched-chain amino acid aminotransferase